MLFVLRFSVVCSELAGVSGAGYVAYWLTGFSAVQSQLQDEMNLELVISEDARH